MSALVYQAINAVAAELADSGIARTHRNEEGDYSYRSIDDVLGALAPLLARHRLCVLPRVLKREALRCSRTSQLVSVHVAFDLVSALDGSVHTIESFGEAIDDSDKGTAKAISSAFKSAMLQAFCIPVPQEDSDAASPRLHPGKRNGASRPEPPEGWESWATEVIDIIAACQSGEAVDRLCATRRQLLSALQHSRPELYAKVGEAIAARLAALHKAEGQPSRPASAPRKAELVATTDSADAPARAPRKAAGRSKTSRTADAAHQAPQAA